MGEAMSSPRMRRRTSRFTRSMIEQFSTGSLERSLVHKRPSTAWRMVAALQALRQTACSVLAPRES
ncbi:hypothetical protein A8E97_00025 [Burkholderia cenocepacia]|nr:hypothetical protein A8E89_27835 [Burkholderia cenocepacia]ONW04546.1 hypothetical protein A8E94_32600 [Burkholderia cenocepacia]ONW26490.1 hypothetical protein A8E90_00335 [Burkholderia cenocepacia]ONW34886.1 hypothetical protein A8E93_26760 [Burkholderia cenocepacia]ONW52069.1 hypothetical protein A8E99_00165 [Burkholderia cenocepacia]